MRLYLIRHAESENNVRDEHERVEDPAITARGVRQAEQLADWLATHPFDVLLTSPFRRALETARPIAHRTGREVHVWCDIYEQGGCYRGWHEANYEGAAGLGREAILELLPGATVEAAIGPSGWWGELPRETQDETLRRAAAVRGKLEREFVASDRRVVAIVHADFQRLLLAELLGDDIDVGCLGPICNTGVTHLTHHAGRWQLQWFNAVTHLSGELITEAKG